jgi:hypothetical protein
MVTGAVAGNISPEATSPFGNIFADATRGILFDVQLHARMKALGWAKEGKVVAPVLQIFEDTLYEYYEPVSA